MKPVPASAASRPFVRHLLPAIPAEPGVYLFYSQTHQLLYVGKSKDLRKRVAQHLDPGSDPGSTRIRVMHASVDAVSWISTTTELVALVLEDALIKKLRPVYNKRQAKMPLQVWLTVSGRPVPTIRIVSRPTVGSDRRPTADGSHVSSEETAIFGPFKDRHYTGTLVEILRTCYGAHSSAGYAAPTRRRGRVLMGNSLLITGPVVDPSQCFDAVCRFLDGNDDVIVSHIRSEMARFTERRAYESAARMRDTVRFCESFFRRRRFMLRFADETLVITDEEFRYRFERGDLVSMEPVGLAGTRSDRAAIRAIDTWSRWTAVDHDRERTLFDRAAVVSGWIRTHPDAQIRFEPAG